MTTRALQYQRHKDVWEHGLDFLDNYYRDPQLASFYRTFEGEDETGVMKKHQEWFTTVSTTPDHANKGVKAMYLELINMLLDQDKDFYPYDVQQVTKLQGFQDLTNRLQRKINVELRGQLANIKADFADYRNQVETKHHVYESELKLLRNRENVTLIGNNYDRPDSGSTNINIVDIEVNDKLKPMWDAIERLQREADEERERRVRSEGELQAEIFGLKEKSRLQDAEISNLREKELSTAKKLKSLKGKLGEIEDKVEKWEHKHEALTEAYHQLNELIKDNKNEIDRLKLRGNNSAEVDELRREVRRLAEELRRLPRTSGIDEKALKDMELKLMARIGDLKDEYKRELEYRLTTLRDTIMEEIARALARHEPTTIIQGGNTEDLEHRIEAIAERLELMILDRTKGLLGAASLESFEARLFQLESGKDKTVFNIDQITQDITNIKINVRRTIDDVLKSEQENLEINIKNYVLDLINRNREESKHDISLIIKDINHSRPSTPSLPISRPEFTFEESKMKNLVVNMVQKDNTNMKIEIMANVRKEFEDYKRDLKADVSEGLYEMEKLVTTRVEECKKIVADYGRGQQKFGDLEGRLGGLEMQLGEYLRRFDSMGSAVAMCQNDLSGAQRLMASLGDEVRAAMQAWLEGQMQGFRMEMGGKLERTREGLNSLYSNFRGSTFVLSADRNSHDHQRQCMGVYRMTGLYNGAPVYQQDRGDYYIYFWKTESIRDPDYWIVGEHIGQTHGWFRARARSGERIPHNLSDWEYQPLSNRVAGNREMVWLNNDNTIGLKTLPDLVSYRGQLE